MRLKRQVETGDVERVSVRYRPAAAAADDDDDDDDDPPLLTHRSD